MKRIALVIVIVTVSLLQQGCYTTASRSRKYFASTQYVWSHGSDSRTVGECIMRTGTMIPIVGAVALHPAGGIVNVLEHYVVAPAFDIVLLPVDCLVHCGVHLRDEANYKELKRRLESDFDATIADAEYWRSNDGDVKLRHLKRWLSQQDVENALTEGQLSAILSLLEEGLTGNDINKMHACLVVFATLYLRVNDQASLASLANWLVEMKGHAQVDSILFKLALESPSGGVKFDDEQLKLMRDAGIMPSEINRILMLREAKRDKSRDGRGLDYRELSDPMEPL